jgi:hypothetical protein
MQNKTKQNKTNGRQYNASSKASNKSRVKNKKTTEHDKKENNNPGKAMRSIPQEVWTQSAN